MFKNLFQKEIILALKEIMINKKIIIYLKMLLEKHYMRNQLHLKQKRILVK